MLDNTTLFAVFVLLAKLVIFCYASSIHLCNCTFFLVKANPSVLQYLFEYLFKNIP